MTVSVVYASSDGYIESGNNNAGTMRSGSGLSANTAAATIRTGQTFLTPTYYGFQMFLAFDTSVVGTDDISDAVLALYPDSDDSTTNFVTAIGAYDWSSGGLTTADWRTTAQLGGITDLATFDSAGLTFAYKDFTNTGGGIASVINKTGTTYLIGYSTRLKAATDPTNNEYILWNSAEEAIGDERRPRLTITHAAPAGGGVAHAILGTGFFGG